jgi:hypothetical protein
VNFLAVSADEPSEISTTSTEATTIIADIGDVPVEEVPMEEVPMDETPVEETPQPSEKKQPPEFIRPLVSDLELPEGGVAK